MRLTVAGDVAGAGLAFSFARSFDVCTYVYIDTKRNCDCCFVDIVAVETVGLRLSTRSSMESSMETYISGIIARTAHANGKAHRHASSNERSTAVASETLTSRVSTS